MKFLLALVVLIAISSSTSAHPDGKKSEMKHMCLGTELKFTDEMKATMKTCYEKYAPPPPPTDFNKDVKMELTAEQKDNWAKNTTCIHVCKFQSAGIISAEGVIVKDKLISYIKEFFPESAIAALTTEANTCVDTNAALVLKDGKCEVFLPFVKCNVAALKKVCKNDDKEME